MGSRLRCKLDTIFKERSALLIRVNDFKWTNSFLCNIKSYMRRDSRLSMALHVLLHMAEARASETSQTLGERMKVNPVVIRRTFAGLRDRGLVESAKGHGGGWRVARDLKEISLLDVYEALGEPVLLHQHQEKNKASCLVEQTIDLALGETFEEAESLVKKRFESIRLSDLSREFHDRMKSCSKKGKASPHA